MFFAKSKALVILSRTNLSFFSQKNSAPVTYNFESDTIKDLEVKNIEQLTLQLNTFIKNNRLKPHEALILLMDNVYFLKILTEKDPKKLQGEIQKFLDEVPIDPQKTISQAYQEKGGALIIATNKELYLSISQILKNLKWKILAVIPTLQLAQIGLDQTNLSTAANMNKVFDSIEQLESKSLPISQEEFSQKSEGGESIGFIKKYQILILIILILSVLLILSLFFLSSFRPWQKSQPNLSGKPNITSQSPGATSSQFPESTFSSSQKFDKEKIKIQILNGSGVIGQAASLADSLKNLGYLNFTLGNSQTQDNNETVAIFNSDLPSEMRNGIHQVLQQKFSSVNVKDSQNPEFDISITTGTLK